MKSIIQKEKALSILFDKEEKVILDTLAELVLQEQNLVNKITLISSKIKNTPSPIFSKQINDTSILINYSNFISYLSNAENEFKEQLIVIQNSITETKKKLLTLHNKKKVFFDYFNKLKKKKQFILDKKEEAILLDQFNSLRKLLGEDSIEEI